MNEPEGRARLQHQLSQVAGAKRGTKTYEPRPGTALAAPVRGKSAGDLCAMIAEMAPAPSGADDVIEAPKHSGYPAYDRRVPISINKDN